MQLFQAGVRFIDRIFYKALLPNRPCNCVVIRIIIIHAVAKKALVASDWVPRAAYERAETDLKVARQHIAPIEQQIANTVVALNNDPDIQIGRRVA
jgi:hypothetical protein